LEFDLQATLVEFADPEIHLEDSKTGNLRRWTLFHSDLPRVVCEFTTPTTEINHH
jgi:hypothetical protein